MWPEAVLSNESQRGRPTFGTVSYAATQAFGPIAFLAGNRAEDRGLGVRDRL